MIRIRLKFELILSSACIHDPAPSVESSSPAASDMQVEQLIAAASLASHVVSESSSLGANRHNDNTFGITFDFKIGCSRFGYVFQHQPRARHWLPLEAVDLVRRHLPQALRHTIRSMLMT